MRVWKEISDELVILTIVGILAIIVAFFISGRAHAEITGTIGCQAGELTIINSDRESAWTVCPADYSTSFAVSDDGRTLYFASPIKGKVTFFAASVIDGKPELESHTLYNGVEIPDDESTPTPAPIPAPETIESVIAAADVKVTAADLNALANSFGVAAQSIANGAVTTPAGARETFRAVWLQSAAKSNPEAIDALSDLIDKLSGMVDNSSLQTIQRDYNAAAKALQTKADKLKAAPVQAKPAGGCPSGKCPLKTYKIWGA